MMTNLIKHIKRQEIYLFQDNNLIKKDEKQIKMKNVFGTCRKQKQISISPSSATVIRQHP